MGWKRICLSWSQGQEEVTSTGVKCAFKGGRESKTEMFLPIVKLVAECQLVGSSCKGGFSLPSLGLQKKKTCV